MKVTLIHSVVLTGLLFTASLSHSDQEATREADKLLNTMGMELALQQSISQMLDLQLQQNPDLSPYRKIMLQFFKKHMSFESLKPEVIAIYTEAFSAEELREINQFYSTDVGKKTLEKMPMLMVKGGELGMRRIQENAHELQDMIQRESNRLQALQQNNGIPE